MTSQVIEYLTKFATVRMAMTGQRFFDAGRSVVDLLARNAMDTLGVWWLPPLILQVCTHSVSVNHSLLICVHGIHVYAVLPA